jgi:hypothetical protein
MPLIWATYGQQVIDNLKNNKNIHAQDREALARALCAKVDTIGQAKSLAKALKSPAQLDRLLVHWPIAKICELATQGHDRFQQAVFEHELSQLAPVAPTILSFLPLATQAQISHAYRERANLIRTGGVTRDLAAHLTTTARWGYGRDKPCIVCNGADRHLPMLHESPQTRAIASILTQQIRTAHHAKKRVLKPDGPTTYRGYMLGVLKVGAEVYIAISGSLIPPDLKEVILATGYGSWVHWETPHTTAGDAAIDDVYMAKSTGNSPAEPFMCAAPKLVAATRHHMGSGQTWSMTEMWCGPSTDSRADGHAYASCSNCMDILPMMLCTRKPIPRVSRGFTLVIHTQRGEKNAAAGRPVKGK